MKLAALPIFLLLTLATFTVAFSAGGTPLTVVPAIQEERASDGPCNLSPPGSTACLSGPYKVWTCADKSMILLTAENGTRQCVKFN